MKLYKCERIVQRGFTEDSFYKDGTSKKSVLADLVKIYSLPGKWVIELVKEGK